MPLTSAQIVGHPAFQHAILNLPPTEEGTLAVAKGRGGPFNIAYEIHGTGPIHLVVSRLSYYRQEHDLYLF